MRDLHLIGSSSLSLRTLQRFGPTRKFAHINGDLLGYQPPYFQKTIDDFYAGTLRGFATKTTTPLV